MTGSINELATHLNQNLATNERILESALQKAHNESIEKTLIYLREQAKSRNIGSMLDDERLILTHALKFSANSTEEKNSLKSAIAQLDDCRRCFESLQTAPEAYSKNVETYPAKMKASGLPIDAARDFFKSHSTRLSNILTGNSSDVEKSLVCQRKDNLHMVRDAYVALQWKAMGLEQEMSL